MSRWYRAYEGTVTDPKIGEAALIAESSRSVAIATWHALLESAAGINDAGRFDTTPRRIAVILCEPPALISSVLDAFSELGLITAGAVTAWSWRQYESDSSTERSRRSRQKKKGERRGNDDATLPRRSATPPDTETDSEKPFANANGAAAPLAQPPEAEPPKPVDVKAGVFASGVPLLTSTGMTERNARSMLGRWRQDYGDGAVLDALAAAQTEAPSAPVPWITRTLEVRNATRPSRQSGSRGPRPDPALDLGRWADGELAAEAAGRDRQDHLESRPALPSYLTDRP